MNFLPIIAFVVTIFFQVFVSRKLKKGEVSQEPLSTPEKIITWIVTIFNPILAGAILYYAWRKQLPVKARQANHISMIVFLILIGLFILNALLQGLAK